MKRSYFNDNSAGRNSIGVNIFFPAVLINFDVLSCLFGRRSLITRFFSEYIRLKLEFIVNILLICITQNHCMSMPGSFLVLEETIIFRKAFALFNRARKDVLDL